MAKNSPEIDRLLTEFKAEDLSVVMQVLQVINGDNVRIVVAKFSDGNQSWEMTQAGRDLLTPPEVSAEVTPPPVAPAPRNLDVRTKR